MAYTWEGMRKISFNEVTRRHFSNELVGCFLLYDDDTESMIEPGYDLEDIVRHYIHGGEFGVEIQEEQG